MRIFSTFLIALKALRAHRVRTGLAVLGVMIGISSIIIVFAAGEGINGLLTGQIEAFGVDTIETEVKIPSSKTGAAGEQQSAVSMLTGVQVTTLTLDDMDDLTDLENLRDGYGAIMSQEPITHADEMQRGVVFAISSSYIDIDSSEIDEGRFFLDSEDRGLATVAILGSKMKKELFGESDAIGQFIKVRKTRFKVVGVMKERGAVMGMDFDKFTYIPVRTMQKRIMGINYLHYTLHRVYDLSVADKTAEEMRVLLRENHSIPPPKEIRQGWMDTGKDDFRVVTMNEIMDVWGSMTEGLTIVLLGIVAISLIVGGVGIMNVMYVIVNERTREIGLRKAVGARYSDIMVQFLAESILITLAGGIAGIIFGALISYGIALGASMGGLDWNFYIPLRAFVISISFSVVFGVFFGLYPARQAARKDPVDALRAE